MPQTPPPYLTALQYMAFTFIDSSKQAGVWAFPTPSATSAMCGATKDAVVHDLAPDIFDAQVPFLSIQEEGDLARFVKVGAKLSLFHSCFKHHLLI